jgi:hypothetical protein
MSVVATAAELEVVEATLDGYTLELVDTSLADPATGWVDLAAFGERPELVEQLMLRAGVAAGTPLAAVPATWIVEKAAWFAAAAAFTHLLQRGACAPVEEMRFLHGDAGWAERVAVPPFDGRGVGARGVGARDVGAAAFAIRFEAAFAPVVEALGAHRARRALWFSVGDRIAQAAMWTGAALDRTPEAIELATAVLASPTMLHAPARFAWGADGTPSRRRVGCCLSYRCDDGARCADCPVQPRT